MHEIEIGAPRDDEERATFGRVLTQSLGFPGDRMLDWFAALGPENVRVARRGREVLGGYGAIPMGIWVAGRAVKTAGITAVAIAPEHRSDGVGSALMRSSLVELAAAGYPLASLYPATFPVYRRVGYASAGTRTAYRVSLANLGVRARDGDALAVRAATQKDADLAAMKSLYDARARRTAGNIERTPFMWHRALRPFSGPPVHAYIAEGPEGPEGYIAFAQKDLAGLPRFEILVRDLVALTPAAGRRLLRLLADHRSVARHAIVPAAPSEPVFSLSEEEPYEVADRMPWMLRVIDVEAALAARAYSPAVRGEVHLEVRDDVLAKNDGRFALTVEGGRAEVKRASRGSVVADIRALAALYTGYASAEELRATGLIEGSEQELATLSALFAGPAPWMAEIF